MTYQWKLPGVIPVNAQTAGEELERIYQEKGRLDPADIVDESRSPVAPLHCCFEWDDQKAAEKFRESQASAIVRQITVVYETKDTPQSTRAFVHIQKSYLPISVVVNSDENMKLLLENAKRELLALENKYNSLVELEPVFRAIESIKRIERK